MPSSPSGQLVRTGTGVDLVLTRTSRTPLRRVWASVTEPEHTARWFGPWTGDAAPGNTIRVQAAYEEGAPWGEMRVDACEAPHLLAVSMLDEAGEWSMELRLSKVDGMTVLRLAHHLTPKAPLGEIGPGWEYYLDMLMAAMGESAPPRFEDYYPAQRAHFEGLVAQEPPA